MKETNELLTLVTTHGKKWSEIQNKLNRSADSCRDKYREFHTNFTKGKWKNRESKELEMHVRKVLKVGDDVPLVELGKLAEHDSVNVPWSTISEKMKNRSRLSCFKRFQQITGMKKTSAGKKRKKMEEEDHDGDDGADADADADADGAERNADATGGSSTNTNNLNLNPTRAAHLASAALAPAQSQSEDIVATATATVTFTHAPITTPRTRTTMTTTANPIQSSLPESPSPVHVPITIPIPDPTAIPVSVDISCNQHDVSSYDRQLLHSLATSSYARETDIAWDSIHYPLGGGGAKQRWNFLLDKWIEAFGMDEDEIFDRPVWEVAKEMLNQECLEDEVDADGVGVEDQAEMAARTVEAVFLC